jgi:glycosyltransferase involved in cell wall biosynthesis
MDKLPRSEKASISVFFPCYNEEGNVGRTTQNAVKVLEGIGADYEVIIVNDGSKDKTAQIAAELAAKNLRIKVIKVTAGHCSPVSELPLRSLFFIPTAMDSLI